MPIRPEFRHLFPELAGPTIARAPRVIPDEDLDREQERSIGRSLADVGMGGLEWLGGILDKPGRMVRGVLSGRPRELLNQIPFSDTLGLTDPKDNIDGRGLLEQYGLLEKNKDGLDPGDVAGFATSLVLDPLTWLGGAGVLTKAGKVVSSAGQLKNVSKLAAKAGLGKRAGRMNTTIGDLLQQFPDAEPALRRAAEGKKIPLASLLDEPLAHSSARMSIPGTEIGFNLPGGKLARKVAGGLDAAGHAARYGKIPGTDFSPGIEAARLFHAPSGALTTEVSQKVAQNAFDNETVKQAAVREKHADWVQRLQKAGFTGPDAERELTRLIESPTAITATNPEAAKVAGEIGQFYDELHEAGFRKGTSRRGKLQDTKARFLHRVGNLPQGEQAKLGKGRQAFSMATAQDVARKPYMKEIEGGTDTINQIFTHPEIVKVVDAGLASGAKRSDVTKQVAPLIEQLFPGMVRPAYALMKKGKPVLDDAGMPVAVDQHMKLAHLITAPGSESARKIGFDPYHPVAKTESYGLNEVTREANADAIFEAIPDLLRLAKKLPREETVPLGNLLKGLGLRSVVQGDEVIGATKQIADIIGLSPGGFFNKDMAKAVRQQRIPKSEAKALLDIRKKFDAPEEVSKLVKYGIDSPTNVIKAGMLTAPARYSRDAVSGKVMNALEGNFSVATEKAARAIDRGDVYQKAHEIPIVRDWLLANNRPLTAEEGTQRLRSMYAGMTDGGQHLRTDVIGPAGEMTPGFEDMLATIPGAKPSTAWGSIKGVASDAWAGMPFTKSKPGISKNPLTIKGAFGNKETKFGPVVAGNRVGKFTDTMNRLAPMIKMLEEGVDPAEVARRIKSSQVDYSGRSFTPIEKKVMKRLFPFYSFSSRMAPHIAKTLAEKPGGALAQTIRGTNALRGDDPFVPEYIKQGLAIPLPSGESGDPRFLGGLGLMHEDPLSFLGAGVGGAGMEVLSRLNPIFKAPMEWSTGESFFQRGPDGGRPLDDLDPTIGRLLSNIGLGDGKKPVKWPGSEAMEMVIANSPAARVASTARMLTDTRKGVGTKALNFLSGAKITDVPPQTREALIREGVQRILKSDHGAKDFERIFIPKEELDKMSPEDRQAAEQLLAMLKTLANKAKARKQLKPVR